MSYDNPKKQRAVVQAFMHRCRNRHVIRGALALVAAAEMLALFAGYASMRSGNGFMEGFSTLHLFLLVAGVISTIVIYAGEQLSRA
jgi:hypothetical protein